MIERGCAWARRATWAFWLLALPAQASSLGDLVKKGDVAAVASALDKGAAVNEIDGVTALYIACEGGNVELAGLLIKHGADVNLPVSWQRTPLYAANKGGHAEIVKLLLDSGANPNQVAKAQTPLHVAAENGCLQCVIHLVDAGADVNALTSNGSPPIHLAKLSGHNDVAAYLHGHGAGRPAIAPISARLASANAQSGKEIYDRTCGACHLSPGVRVPKKVSLWGIMGRQKGSQNDVQYSSALKDAGGNWTFEELNFFISNPAMTLPGTDMSFPGLKDENQRADLIAYLRTLSETPVPLPDN
ncbi:ankyrin repeat domain-containing protein [Mesorhizobium sp. M1B.F.Ca.ET.045.04.1.1]|uniref:ankyrin repeat domain-containing protein n=1 Tax=Mesorhizobium sp. M1B.F.Ca.ET.045.04.1.1 TaxID=2493673 RepID=UPI000F7504B7|nr:ankyrin repeat domain-containing protein [Mesorhizobium sp. M1B.F.Ca.ET.045.04.1.1]AZO30868.1 c-type cytochrome [Mesorhizobium sp. M1B.F.Ca.ET.045.04.1.1]